MFILGIDEVGRGCWAGPLVVGAVILDHDISGLKDSKLVKKSDRVILAQTICEKATFVGFGWVGPKELDDLGLTGASKLGIERAIKNAPDPDEIIIDGNINFLPTNKKARSVIKADQKFPSVSAASIVAKVARDKYMSEISLEYPNYGFENHVGYGTAEHKAALAGLGVTDIHRQSYKPIKALTNGSA